MGRRAKGQGSVYRRKDGLYVAQYNGVYRYSKSEDGANEKLRKLIAGEDARKPQSITVGTAIEDYLQHARTQGNLKRLTLQRYQEAYYRHLKSAFGTVKLDQLDVRTIEDAYTQKLRSGLSPASIRLIHAVLSAALKRKVCLGYIESNVCRNVELPKDKDRDEVEIFTLEEVSAILSAASEDRLEALWVCALSIGARLGELLALKGTDVDISTGKLRISKTVHNGVCGSPKSKHSRRVITLSRIAQQVLARHPKALTMFVLCAATHLELIVRLRVEE